MNAEKKKFNPWIVNFILGVTTIFFFLDAVQSQTELIKSRKELEQTKQALKEAKKRAQITEERVQAQMPEALRESTQASVQAELNYNEAARQQKSATSAAKKK